MFLVKKAIRLIKFPSSNPFDNVDSTSLYTTLLQSESPQEQAIYSLFTRNNTIARSLQEKLLFLWIQNPSRLTNANCSKFYEILNNSLSNSAISPRYKMRAGWLMAILSNTLPEEFKNTVASIDQDSFIPGFADFYPTRKVLEFLQAMRVRAENPSGLITNYYFVSTAHLKVEDIEEILPMYLGDFRKNQPTLDLNDQLFPLLAFLECMSDEQRLKAFNQIVKCVQIEPLSFIKEILSRFLAQASDNLVAQIKNQVADDFVKRNSPEHQGSINEKYYRIYDLHNFMNTLMEQTHQKKIADIATPANQNELSRFIDDLFKNLQTYPRTLAAYEGAFRTLMQLVFSNDQARVIIKEKIDQNYDAQKCNIYCRFQQQLRAACILKTCLPNVLQAHQEIDDTETMQIEAIASH
ncbi:hypothetical protein Lqui_0991 [Legionella quinlivanii]|uniref:Uncharacterized protein n=1 Tax=Legionella quinlivanii TaxID=45073 RepID=A0A0W0Y6I2_9GAMM|nr:hypothetical protein [Legionella quinlivanii]KTD52147.1 hypothetical protein Lqui_0991 [Legionella quinlivanii]SEF77358.1 hypothetical protein SAMN02746093_01062 [Legionella quinlivanii DSM 21216]STY12354.1 Uncharacterised protein [Legionella quinlivanii]